MSSSQETLTQKWLRQNIQPYVQKDTVYSHVDAALSRFPSIRPKTDVYTYDDGRTQLLLCLHGLLPISYRGTSYNIPIAVWFTREYPRLPPIAYVVPTSDMLVRASKHMDVSGRCQIEYILNWEKKSEGCNLVALLEAMQDHFSREPPVYAKPQGYSSPHPQGQPARSETVGSDYSGRPPPPPPGSHSSPSPLTHPAPISRGSNDDRPPLPAKPGTSSSSLTTRGVSPAASSPIGDRMQSPGVLGSPSYATRPPPLPPQPPVDSGLPQYRQSPMPPRYVMHELASPVAPGPIAGPPPINSASHPVATWPPPNGVPVDPNAARGSTLPYASPAPTNFQVLSPVGIRAPGHVPYSSPPYPLRPPPPISPPRITQPQPQAHHETVPPTFLSQHSASSTAYPMQPPPPPPVAPSITAPPLSTASPIRPSTAGLHPPPSIPPPDIMDAEDDLAGVTSPPASALAPPRPPNPELVHLHNQVHTKLTSELASLSQAMALDAERLRAHQTDLLAGEPAIRDEMARLEAVRDVCTSVATRMGKVVEDAERNIAELKRKGDPDVDELVCSTTIVHNQLINLVAEDNAIEDTMYHLHRALNAGRIDLERFLRTTRVLAEEQFMKRALTEKILSGIPMSDSALSMRPEWS